MEKKFRMMTWLGVMTISLLCVTLLATMASAASVAYTSYTEIGQAIADNTFVPDVKAKSGPAVPIQQAITGSFPSRAGFDAAYPGAPLEDFADTLIPDNGLGAFFSPLNSSSDNGSYTPGAIMDGISIGAIGGDGDMVVLTTGFLGVPSAMVGPNSFAANTEIIFSENNVFAVGMDIFLPLVSGTADIEISVYGPGNALQDTFSFASDPDGEFLGIVADLPIRRIVLSTPNGELIDNLSFALAPYSIPTLSEWGIIVLTLSLLGIGVFVLRRRQVATLA